MESRDVLKIQGALRRYCTSRVSLRSILEVQYLLNLPCIFNTSLDSMLYLLNTMLQVWSWGETWFIINCISNLSTIYTFLDGIKN